MSKMKLIIDISEEAYELLKSKSELDNIAESIIANGTPITEGDLISRSALRKEMLKIHAHSGGELSIYCKICDFIDNAPSIGGNQNE